MSKWNLAKKRFKWTEKNKWDDVEVQLGQVCENYRNFEWDDHKSQNLIRLLQSLIKKKKDMFHCIHVHSFEATDLSSVSTPIYYVCKQTNNPKAFDYIHIACLFLNNSLERFIVWPKFTFNADSSIAFGSLQLPVMKIIFCNCSICIQKEN